jgi:isocitrate/isopropylmalate dehydrogenase
VAHRIAVIPGDGIGKEVTAESIRILEALGGLEFHHLPWSADHFLATGETIPPDGYDCFDRTTRS